MENGGVEPWYVVPDTGAGGLFNVAERRQKTEQLAEVRGGLPGYRRSKRDDSSRIRSRKKWYGLRRSGKEVKVALLEMQDKREGQEDLEGDEGGGPGSVVKIESCRHYHMHAEAQDRVEVMEHVGIGSGPEALRLSLAQKQKSVNAEKKHTYHNATQDDRDSESEK